MIVIARAVGALAAHPNAAMCQDVSAHDDRDAMRTPFAVLNRRKRGVTRSVEVARSHLTGEPRTTRRTCCHNHAESRRGGCQEAATGHAADKCRPGPFVHRRANGRRTRRTVLTVESGIGAVETEMGPKKGLALRHRA